MVTEWNFPESLDEANDEATTSPSIVASWNLVIKYFSDSCSGNVAVFKREIIIKIT
jgi:hypothetical protein